MSRRSLSLFFNPKKERKKKGQKGEEKRGRKDKEKERAGSQKTFGCDGQS
jgi:hypothetical protein